MGIFALTKRTMGLKLEGTPGTAETLAVGDYNFKAYNINYSVEIEENKRKYAMGNFAPHKSIMGRRTGTVSFSVDLTNPGDAAPPNYGKIFMACGLGETGTTVYTAASLLTNVTATIEVVEMDEGATPAQLVIKIKGAMGNVKFVADGVGKLVRMDFEFKGILSNISDRSFGSIIFPASVDSYDAEVLINGVANYTYGSLSLDKFTIDLGNDIQMETDVTDPSGYKSCHIVNRNITWTVDPYLDLLAGKDYFASWTAPTLAALVFSLGSTNTVTLYIPKAQIVKAYNPSDRTGMVVNTLEGIAVRTVNEDAAGGDDIFTISFETP